MGPVEKAAAGTGTETSASGASQPNTCRASLASKSMLWGLQGA